MDNGLHFTSRLVSSAAAVQHRASTQALKSGLIFARNVERPTQVVCLSGELWVTGPGLDDEVLTAETSVRTAGRGRLVVQALRSSRFRIVP